MSENLKEVYYSEYCNKCKHYEESEAEDSCHYCLEEPARNETHKPLNFEEA